MNFGKDKAIALLNRIMELELAGVVRYTHYSLMVYGYSRIPVVEWLKEQAEEGLVHAHRPASWSPCSGAIPRFPSDRCWKHICMTWATYSGNLWRMKGRRSRLITSCMN